jgi:elongation factor G
MLDFEPTLTSITGGRGSFLMEYSHMEEVPAQLQQKIIAEAVKEGRVSGMEQKGTMRTLKATVPMSEMLDFEPTLTSITGGRGSYLMEFSHMEEVPAQLQQKIIAEAVKEGRVRPEEED